MLAIGAVHVPVLVVAASVALAAGALTLWSRSEREVLVPPPAGLLAALGAYTALQAVPVPMSWLRHLEPVSADIWARSYTVIGEQAPRWASISVDPGATWVEALKWCAYAAAFIAAATVGRERGARWGASLLFSSAMALAVLTMAHGAVNASAVYGIYEPRFGAERWHVSPLVNPNNYAGYLNLGVLSGLGLVGSDKPPLPRWALSLGVATVLAASLLSGSRGGVGTLVVGLIALVFLLGRARRSAAASRALRRVLMPFVLTVAGGIVFALIALDRHTIESFLQKDVSKLRVMAWAVPMLRDHPWLGIGRGAFQTVFPQYYIGPNDAVMSHPENFVVQWATEWGIPITLVALAATAWFFRPKALARLEGPSAMGVLSGLLALIVQNIADLSFEVPGVMFAVVAAAGCLWGHAGAPRETRELHTPSRGRMFARIVVAVGGVFATITWTLGGRTILQERDDLLIDFPKNPKDPVAYANYRDEVRAAMHRHPAEPYFPRMGASLAWQGRKENPMPWIELALERAAMSGRTNYLLALILAERGLKEQALLELRIAADYAPVLAERAGALAVKLGQDPAWLRRVVPSGRNGAPVLVSLAIHLPDGQTRAQDAFLEEATARDPDFVEAHSMLVDQLLAALENPDESSRCTGADAARCAGVVISHCDALERLRPDSPAPLVFKGRAYIDTGRPLLAAQKLSTQCQRFTDRVACLEVWLEAAATAHDTKLAMQAAKQLELDGCAGQHRCASTYESIADALHRAGDENASLEYYEKAARLEPEPERWRRAADAAAAMTEALRTKGDLPGAIAYAERAARLDPQVARWRRVAELKEPPEEGPPSSSAAQLPEEARDAIMRAHLLGKRAK